METDLLHDFAQVTRTFEQLSQRLADVAEQVRTSGTLPSETLIDDITKSRKSFSDLRDRALELLGLMAELPSRTSDDIGSMKDLETVLQLVAEAQRKKVQEEKARLRALTILDGILSLIHRDEPQFPPLDEVQTKARALRDSVRAHDGREVHHDIHPLAQGRHPLAELLTLVEGYADLDDDLWLLLQHAVAENFGKSMALSAARGKLCPSPTRLVSEPPSPESKTHLKAAVVSGTFTDGDVHSSELAEDH